MQYYYETIVLKIVYFGRKLLACSVEKQIYVITLIVSRKTELLPFYMCLVLANVPAQEMLELELNLTSTQIYDTEMEIQLKL